MNGDFDQTLERAMKSTFPDAPGSSAQLYEMVEYHLGLRNEHFELEHSDGGKKIRPRLCLLGCEMVGGDPSRALPVAAAIQLFHEHTLVLDDIQDRSDLRRGRPTVWRLWGEAKAINVGNVIAVLARRSLAQLADVGVASEAALAIMRQFEAVALDVSKGQQLDLSYENRLDLSEADYLTMIEHKTARLLAAALTLGARVGEASPKAVDALERFAINLGLAFQIQDDVLGVWGDPAITGKPFAIDLYGHKKSLPVIYALANADGHDQSFLHSVYSRLAIDENNVDQVLAILEKYAVRAYTEDQSARYYDRALSALEDVEGARPDTLDLLRALLQNLVHRVN